MEKQFQAGDHVRVIRGTAEGRTGRIRVQEMTERDNRLLVDYDNSTDSGYHSPDRLERINSFDGGTMNERIRKSMDYVKAIYRYDIDESTVAILNEESEYWVAKCTTTHLKASGEKEITLVVLVQGYDVTVIPHAIVPSLARWFSQHCSEEE